MHSCIEHTPFIMAPGSTGMLTFGTKTGRLRNSRLLMNESSNGSDQIHFAAGSGK
jgi:hypothetical protein